VPKASLQKVATEAGVSASTVSRYLNGTLSLREDTERRILDAVERTGYEHHRRRAASETVSRRIVGLILPEIGNEYFGAISDAIIESAEQQGVSVVLCSTMNHRRKQAAYVELMASLGVSGIIYVGNYATNEALAEVVRSGLPVVVLDEVQAGLPPVDTVVGDDYSGAFQATSYLLSQGHKRIALATGPAELHSVRERRRGYQDALTRAGVDPAEQTDMEGAFSDEFGAAVLTNIIASQDRPTAVFAASDIIAVGLVVAARRLGVRVPEDLSVVGFDDIPAAEYLVPRLTTVRMPLGEISRAALELLVERMEDPGLPPRNARVSVALEVRDSALQLAR
jgi:LacI family transcriptional regulator